MNFFGMVCLDTPDIVEDEGTIGRAGYTNLVNMSAYASAINAKFN
jgi:hypothetical protein